MKKGCFVKAIIFLTILTAVILYIVTHKFNEVIFNPGKRLIINQINRNLNYVKETPEKDSLQLLIGEYIKDMKKIDNLSDQRVKEFVETLTKALKDSVIDKDEYRALSKILKSKVVK